MKWIYVSALFGAVIFMLICFVYTVRKSKGNVLEKAVNKVLLCSSASLFVNSLAVLMPDKNSAVAVYSIYHCIVDITIISLSDFVRQYTGIASKIPKEKLIKWLAFAVDCVLMIINIFTGIVFQCHAVADDWDISCFHIGGRTPVYIYHLVFIYFMVFSAFFALISKSSESPTVYKGKYMWLAIPICVVTAFHVAFLNFHFMFDYSLLFYAIIGFLACYYGLFYIPRGLMENIMFFTIASMKDGIICLDIDGKCVHFNKNANLYCNAYSDLNTIEQKVKEMREKHVSPERKEAVWESKRLVFDEERLFTVEYKSIFDSHHHYLGCFFIIHDHTEETNRLEYEKYRATHDMLTGIYNKDYFFETAHGLIVNNPDKKYYIICSDVKNFKLVNDIFGVETGDDLLRKIARLMTYIGKESGVYGRLSSDRFAVCLESSHFNEEMILDYTNMIDSLPENDAFKVHIHIGVYEVIDRNIRVSVMCDRANLAIKTIKDSYENVVAYYDSHIREDFINEQKVISEFENAIESGQFRAYVQPQITTGGKINGGEVLVRWIHPTDGMIPPFRFIEIFEQTGLISRLDCYMWELACIQLDKWKKEGRKDYYLSVNISQKDFYLLDVYLVITSLVRKYRINPKCLHLEITETAIMNNPSVQLKLIQRLRNFGFIIEIDDFGSGYSSLNTLKDLSADVLKVDMGFLRNTENKEERSKKILQMIVSLAKSLDMEVITEGVETKEQVDFLMDFGCDVFQGYFFAKPMPVENFEDNYLDTNVDI
ncbi:MAG: GGDEF domain-containing phosphodiesterase [Ruminococcus sp.]|nr:GGDEF domain-containing phosphodiesterase [Ruminococcus sp.]